MTITPKALAARDQLEAACRDRFDKNGVSLYDPHDRLAILTVIGIIADAALAWRPTPDEDTAERRCASIGFALEAIVRLVETGE